MYIHLLFRSQIKTLDSNFDIMDYSSIPFDILQ